MVLWRGTGGVLVVHSAIALQEAGMEALAAIGEPTHMIVPNGFHRMDCGVWKDRFPKLRVLAPAAARKRVEERVAVDATAEDGLAETGTAFHTPIGTKPGELLYEITTPQGRALVAADLLFNLSRDPGGFSGFILRHVTASLGPLGTSRVFKLLVQTDREAYRGWWARLAESPDLKALLVAHGDVVTGDVGAQIREAIPRFR